MTRTSRSNPAAEPDHRRRVLGDRVLDHHAEAQIAGAGCLHGSAGPRHDGALVEGASPFRQAVGSGEGELYLSSCHRVSDGNTHEVANDHHVAALAAGDGRRGDGDRVGWFDVISHLNILSRI